MPFVHGLLFVFVLAAPSVADDDFKEFRGHTGATRAGLFTPDGKLLVTSSGWPLGDGTVRVYDLKTGKELRSMKASKGDVNDMAMSPDGKFVYTAPGGGDGVVRGWDVATGKEVMKFEGQDKNSNVSCVLVAPDGKTAASGGSDKRLCSGKPPPAN